MKITRKITRKTMTEFDVIIPEDKLKEAFNLPERAILYVEVPGGGDYSGEEFTLEQDGQLKARWEVVTVDTA